MKFGLQIDLCTDCVFKYTVKIKQYNLNKRLKMCVCTNWEERELHKNHSTAKALKTVKQ